MNKFYKGAIIGGGILLFIFGMAALPKTETVKVEYQTLKFGAHHNSDCTSFHEFTSFSGDRVKFEVIDEYNYKVTVYNEGKEPLEYSVNSDKKLLYKYRQNYRRVKVND